METIIRVEKLCKNYANVRAIENLDISVYRGEVFGLLGANGAGKSTTIECILGTKKTGYWYCVYFWDEPPNRPKGVV